MNLRKGSRGPSVSAVQGLLNRHGATPRLRQDGVFGAMTEAAVISFQRRTGLTADGIVGPRTWARLAAVNQIAPSQPGASPTPQPMPAPAPVPPALNAPPNAAAPWMDVARAEMGVSEIPGAQHNSRIVEYHAATTLGAGTDEVPWCASFVNWVLREAGFAGSRSALAASFLDWGTTLQTGREGAIIVIRHTTSGNQAATGSSTGNHVGFLLSASPSAVRILGGNQGNKVKESTFPLSGYEIRGYRWPSIRI